MMKKNSALYPYKWMVDCACIYKVFYPMILPADFLMHKPERHLFRRNLQKCFHDAVPDE